MRPHLSIAAVALIGVTVFGSGCALAQSRAPVRCLEGRTASGQCVDAGLAATLSQIASIFSQQKISETAYPVLPSDDAKFRYPDQVIGFGSQNRPSNNSNF